MQVTYIRLEIKPTSPWRIGAAGEVRNAQEAVTDADGQPIIPSSSLAGAFRHHIGEELAHGLMGKTEEPEQNQETTRYFASDLWFLGVTLQGSVDNRRRTATAISRHRKAARNHGSHDVDEVYDTSTIRLYLRYEGRAEHVLDLLASWPVTIGGGVSTGLGQAEVSSLRYRVLDLENPADVLARVTVSGAGSDAIDKLLEQGVDRKVEAVAASVVLKADVCIDRLNIAVNNLADDPKADDYWFHGTRWKGILRSRVEYIGRSLGMELCGHEETEWHGCGKCAVCEIFGSGETGVGRWAFGFTKLSEDKVTQHERTRNAIDRFTGGVSPQKLFPERTFSQERAQFVIRSLVKPEKRLEDRHLWVAKALLLALKDINDGFVGIGGRTATGLGGATFSQVALGADLAGEEFRPVGEAGCLKESPKITREDLEADGRFRADGRFQKETTHV